jgi:hypothetical protein
MTALYPVAFPITGKQRPVIHDAAFESDLKLEQGIALSDII